MFSFTMDGTPSGIANYLLVEFSDYAIPSQINNALLRLFAIGLTPRVDSPGTKSDPAAGRFRPPYSQLRWSAAPCTSWRALRMFPVLSAARTAVAKVSGPNVARALVDDNPQAIVNGRHTVSPGRLTAGLKFLEFVDHLRE
jgi:hypothetical protein